MVVAPDRSTELTDEALMALIRDRDDDALALLYDRHHRAAFSLAYRILNDFGQARMWCRSSS